MGPEAGRIRVAEIGAQQVVALPAGTRRSFLRLSANVKVSGVTGCSFSGQTMR
jgi:hypothetical protein